MSAPSGAGKTTLIRRLLATYREVAERLVFAVSHTTRAPREGEVDGKDYHFVDRSAFEARAAAGGFLEWAVVHGQLYGTGKTEVERRLDQGFDVLLDIDVQGAEQVLRQRPDVPSIFIMPPGFDELRRRLETRASDGPREISRRLRTATSEVRQFDMYEYVILNQELDRACASLAAVFLARRCHRNRMGQQIRQVLEGFPSLEDLPGDFQSR